MGSHARKAGWTDGSSEARIIVPVALADCETAEGWTVASYARETGRSFSSANSALYRGWRDGKFTRRRGRHPDYRGRVGWLYQEVDTQL